MHRQRQHRLFGSTLDPDAVAYANRCPITPSYAFLRILSDYFRSLKAAGLWSDISIMYCFANENQSNALIPIIGTAAATAVNSPTFTAYQGFTTNGSSSYILSGLNANAGLRTASSGSVAYYTRTNMGALNANADVGVQHSTAGTNAADQFRPWAATTLMGSRLNSAAANGGAGTNRPSAGLHFSVRLSSTQVRHYYNGVAVYTSTPTNGVVPNKPHAIGCFNGSSFTNFVAKQFSAFYTGGVSDANAALFNSLFQAFRSKIGF